jgi:hypothetical protein
MISALMIPINLSQASAAVEYQMLILMATRYSIATRGVQRIQTRQPPECVDAALQTTRMETERLTAKSSARTTLIKRDQAPADVAYLMAIMMATA